MISTLESETEGCHLSSQEEPFSLHRAQHLAWSPIIKFSAVSFSKMYMVNIHDMEKQKKHLKKKLTKETYLQKNALRVHCGTSESTAGILEATQCFPYLLKVWKEARFKHKITANYFYKAGF